MKKLTAIILSLTLLFPLVKTPIKANEGNLYNEPLTLSEYEYKLSESASKDVDLPLPKNTAFRENWIETTKNILEKKNNGYKIEKVVKEGNTVTFEFEPLTYEILSKMIKKDNGVLVKAFTAELITEPQFGYLASVTYETTATGQTRIDNYYNCDDVKNLDESSVLKDVDTALSVLLTVVEFKSEPIATAIKAYELIKLCLGLQTIQINNNNRYQVLTRVQNLYKTKLVWGYSGITWVIGAQVQRQEQYMFLTTYKKDSSNKVVKTFHYENAPDSNLANYNTWREKTYYRNETWLKNRALLVSAGQASVYYDLYKTFLSGTYF